MSSEFVMSVMLPAQFNFSAAVVVLQNGRECKIAWCDGGLYVHRRTSESMPSSHCVGALQAVMAEAVLPSTTCGAGETGHFALHAVMHAGGSGESAGIQTHSHSGTHIHTQSERSRRGSKRCAASRMARRAVSMATAGLWMASQAGRIARQAIPQLRRRLISTLGMQRWGSHASTMPTSNMRICWLHLHRPPGGEAGAAFGQFALRSDVV